MKKTHRLFDYWEWGSGARITLRRIERNSMKIYKTDVQVCLVFEMNRNKLNMR